MKTRTFKRSKRTWTNEAEALADVYIKQPEIDNAPLTAAHTGVQFVWTLEVDDQATSPRPVKYSKAEFSENEAIVEAMSDLDTFEGNLNPQHDEEYYVFSKVRG